MMKRLLFVLLLCVSSSLQCSFSNQTNSCPEPLHLPLKMFSGLEEAACKEKCCEEQCRTVVLKEENTCLLFSCGGDDCKFKESDECRVFRNDDAPQNNSPNPAEFLALKPEVSVPEEKKEEEVKPTIVPEEEEKKEEKNPEAKEQKSDVPVCSMPKEVGLCKAAFPKFFFNSESGECERFIYGGCGGNGNNFESKEECERRCRGAAAESRPQVLVQPLKSAKEMTAEEFTEHCKAPSDVGPCRAAFQRWFYDDSQSLCKAFIYGGCKGNKNNYESEEECKNRCQGEPSVLLAKKTQIVLTELNEEEKDQCISAPDPGPCRAAFPMFFFDADSQTCKTFLYGGCKGNGNKYEDKAECEERCTNIGSAAGRGHGRNRWTAAFFLFLTLAAVSFLLLTALIVFTMRRNRIQNQPRRALSIRSDKEELLPDSDSLDSLPLPESPSKP